MNQVINLGVEIAEEIKRVQVNKQVMALQLQVLLLETLIKRLDPNHTYVWSAEYQGFIRESVNEETDNTG